MRRIRTMVAVAVMLIAGVRADADDRPAPWRDSAFRWDLTEEYHFIGNLATGPMYAFGGGRPSFAIPIMGGGIWVARTRDRLLYGGCALTLQMITDTRPDGDIGMALGIQASPVAVRLWEFEGFDIFLKPVYTYHLWKIGNDQIPHHAVGLQLFIH